MYARGYEGGSGLSEGASFGACAGVLIVLLVEAVLYDAIVGVVYKPLARTKAA